MNFTTNYQETYQFSISDPEAFWGEQASHLPWFRQPTEILSQDGLGMDRWFVDGEMNTCYMALDYHVEQGRGNQAALHYISPVTGMEETFTYQELLDQVALLAGGLVELGLQKGDTAIVYMPMIPEAVMAMLACARLGVIHSVVFGGFAPHELSLRIEDAQPKVIFTATCGIEIEKIIPYQPIIDAALQEVAHQPNFVIVAPRPQVAPTRREGRDLWMQEVMDLGSPAPCTPVLATDPLYILYTSGTTGKPKGIIRDNGGHAVALHFSMRAIYDQQPGDVFWAASDIGWVVGHSYIVYGPLLLGGTTLLYEGKPVRTPDAGIFWRIVEKYKVKTLFAAPTAFRAIRKEDPEGKWIGKANLTGLASIFVAGERCDPATLSWLQEVTQKPIYDHWWQTESGWGMVGNMTGIEALPVKPGSATKPICGYDLHILNEAGDSLPHNSEGYVCVKRPLPPGCLPSLWKDHARFEKSYLSTFPGYYLTGDGGYRDEDGYVFIMGRIDDVINVAGHRLSTGAMEEIIATHPAVAECAVIGVKDELKGQVPVGFTVLKDGFHLSADVLQFEIRTLIRNQMGAVASYQLTYHVTRLPKTRSGKILRKTMRQVWDAEPFTVPSTMEDPAVLQELKELRGE